MYLLYFFLFLQLPAGLVHLLDTELTGNTEEERYSSIVTCQHILVLAHLRCRTSKLRNIRYDLICILIP